MYRSGLTKCLDLWVCIGGRSHVKSKLPLRVSLEGPTLEANTASFACRVGTHCCFFEHQTSSWLECKGRLVWRIYFPPGSRSGLRCPHWEELTGMRLTEGAEEWCCLLFLTLGREVIEWVGWCVCVSVCLSPSLMVGVIEFFWEKACVTWHHSSCHDAEFLPMEKFFCETFQWPYCSVHTMKAE